MEGAREGAVVVGDNVGARVGGEVGRGVGCRASDWTMTRVTKLSVAPVVPPEAETVLLSRVTALEGEL